MARDFIIDNFTNVWDERLQTSGSVTLPVMYTLVGFPASIRNRMEVYKVTVTKENSKNNNTSAK